VDIDFGFGKVLRVRWLRAKPERKHLFRRGPESVMQMRERHDKALALLEQRKQMRREGTGTEKIEKQIRGLGFSWQDEPTADDGRYSYWRWR
jgi:hypothetical protein